MCGRFTLETDINTLKVKFNLSQKEEMRLDMYNIAPGDKIPVIHILHEQIHLSLMQWGLMPPWESPSSQIQPINARIESVHEKPMFRKLISKKRCLIPASGFYEWNKSSKPKQPYYFHLPTQGIFAFAGLWDEKITKDGARILSCLILTQKATSDIQSIHHRMPVLIDPSHYDLWLKSPDLNLDDFSKSIPLSFYPVSTAVNSARVDHPDLIRPLS